MVNDKNLYRQVTRLHLSLLPDDFLSQLGGFFLRNAFYGGGTTGKYGKLFYQENNGIITGFVFYTYDTKKFIFDILVRRWYVFLMTGFFRVLFNPHMIVQTIKVIRFLLTAPSAKELEGIKSEIMAIVTNPQYSRQGIATSLLQQMFSELQNAGIRTTKARVSKENKPAIAMYLKTGYQIAGETRFLNREWFLIFRQLSK